MHADGHNCENMQAEVKVKAPFLSLNITAVISLVRVYPDTSIQCVYIYSHIMFINIDIVSSVYS